MLFFRQLFICKCILRINDGTVKASGRSGNPGGAGKYKGVARGGPGAPADQLTLFKPWGADYALHTFASPLGSKMLCTPLTTSQNRRSDPIYSFLSIFDFQKNFWL